MKEIDDTVAPPNGEEITGPLSFLIDDPADEAAEAAVLSALGSGKNAEEAYLAMMKLERSLRAMRMPPDVSGAVLGALHARRERIVTNVMAAAHSRRAPAPSGRLHVRRKAQLVRLATASVLVGATAFAAVRFLHERPEHPSPAHPVRSSAPPVARELPRFVDQPNVPAMPATSEEPNAANPRAVYQLDLGSAGVEGWLRDGVIVAPPDDPRGRARVLMGSLSEYAPRKSIVAINLVSTAPGLRWHEDGTLSFRVWLGEGESKVSVLVYDPDQDQNHRTMVQGIVPERWQDIVVSLRDFRPVSKPELAAENGDRMQNLAFVGGAMPGARMFIDRVTIALPR